MIEEGAQGASATGAPPGTYLPPEVERMDRMIAALPPRMRDALVMDQRHDLRMAEVCARLHCRPQEFHRLVDQAIGWIAGRLAGGAGRD
jgi:DNA-directed RNA polymerase specialized sigma24 family protein